MEQQLTGVLRYVRCCAAIITLSSESAWKNTNDPTGLPPSGGKSGPAAVTLYQHRTEVIRG